MRLVIALSRLLSGFIDSHYRVRGPHGKPPAAGMKYFYLLPSTHGGRGFVNRLDRHRYARQGKITTSPDFVCGAYAFCQTLYPQSIDCPGRPGGKAHNHAPPPVGVYLGLRWEITMRAYMVVRNPGFGRRNSMLCQFFHEHIYGQGDG